MILIKGSSIALPEPKPDSGLYLDKPPVCLEIESLYWYCLAVNNPVLITRRKIRDANGNVFNGITISTGSEGRDHFICLDSQLIGIVGASVNETNYQKVNEGYDINNLSHRDFLLRGLNPKPIIYLEDRQKLRIHEAGGSIGQKALSDLQNRFSQTTFLDSLSWLVSKRTGLDIQSDRLNDTARSYYNAALHLKRGYDFH